MSPGGGGGTPEKERTEEVESLSEVGEELSGDVDIPCEPCLENMGIEREAERRISRGGRDMWLCEKCLQEMGFE